MLRRILALLLLILLTPLLILVSVIIYWDDKSPILFKQERIGCNNSIFWIYKFRTMKNGIPDIPTHLVLSPNLSYTKSGPLLRRLSIDELPQLINIIFGEMVFIGPRPALHNQSDLIELRSNVGVHKLIPGVTGWAQINGRDKMSIVDKVKYDEYYLLNQSFYLDLKIMFMTVFKVFRMHGVSH